MIQLHCTKKLAQKLPMDSDGRLSSKFAYPYRDQPSTTLGSWHANLIVVQRYQCVLMVHDSTRFPVFLPALRQADFRDFDHRFCDAFMNTLLKCGADNASMEAGDAALASLVCDTRCDRSVQGTMNQMVQDMRWMFEICLLYTSPSPRDLSTSRMPSSA